MGSLALGVSAAVVATVSDFGTRGSSSVVVSAGGAVNFAHVSSTVHINDPSLFMETVGVLVGSSPANGTGLAVGLPAIVRSTVSTGNSGPRVHNGASSVVSVAHVGRWTICCVVFVAEV